MTKFYTALALFGALAFGANAEGYRFVAISLANGNQVAISLTDDLTASFTATNLVVEDGNQTIEVPRKNIESFTFSKTSGINEVTADAPASHIEGGAMVFSSLPEGSVIEVYTVAGVLVHSAVASGDYRFDLGGVTGTLIVNVNGVAYKIAAN
ncbi:MAG: hypothetical protein K2M72_01550 [Paramuribaculum sp.]|nr:hypothetical protein [Paramuribaculum sp.]MDE7448879.1 hypothetical protein [Paramuribaculum sp.]